MSGCYHRPMRLHRRTLPWLALAAGALAACGGTQHETVDVPPPSDSATYEDSGGYDSEAARTRAMESRAADLEQKYRDALADPDATEAEKLRAYQEFEAGRQSLDETAESEPADDDSGDD